MVRRSKILWVMMVLALAAMACNLTGDGSAPAAAPTADVPVVQIRVPVNGMSYAEGTNVIVQAVGTDAGVGVSRIDLQVDDLPAGSSAAPNPAGQSAFIANFEWQALGQGLHSVTAVAFRQDGTASTPAVISVNVIAAPPTQPPTETPPPPPTETPPTDQQPPTEPPTPQPTATPSGPRGTVTAGVNVRNGPSTLYPIIGGLIAGTELELRGRNADNSWFVVPFGLSQGWVYGQFLTIMGDVMSLPVITAPPPPPTATPIPPTPVPQPSATTAPAGPSIQFRSTVDENASYNAGTCFRFWWQVTGVSAVYFQGQGVSGDNNTNGQEVCVNQTTTFTLHVVKPDNTTEDRTVTAHIH